MMLYALDNAVAYLSGVVDTNKPIDDFQLADVPESSTDDTIANIPCNNTNGWLYESDNECDFKFDTQNDHFPLHFDNGLWRGHNVGPVAKSLLQAIECHYPNTFQAVQTGSEAIWLPIFKQFHIIIERFFETRVVDLAKEQLTALHEDLNKFERLGFDLSWAHKRLKLVKKLKFGDDTWRHELAVLEQLLEAQELLGKARVEYEKAKDARDKKAYEVADYERVLNGQLGFGMLPRY